MGDLYHVRQEWDEFIGKWSVTIYKNGKVAFHTYRSEKVTNSRKYIEEFKEVEKWLGTTD